MGRTTYYPRAKRLEKLSRKELLDLSFDLINAFRLVKTPFETSLLLQDLLTASEIKNLSKRLRIAKLLLSRENQREIARELHCSTATVTKVSFWLKEGGEGLRTVIQKLPKRYELPSDLPNIPVEFQLPRVLLSLAQYSISKKQTSDLDAFLENVENKKLIDKQLEEMFSQEFSKKK